MIRNRRIVFEINHSSYIYKQQKAILLFTTLEILEALRKEFFYWSDMDFKCLTLKLIFQCELVETASLVKWTHCFKRDQLISFGHMVAACAATAATTVLVFVKIQVQSQYTSTVCVPATARQNCSFQDRSRVYHLALHCSNNSFTQH